MRTSSRRPGKRPPPATLAPRYKLAVFVKESVWWVLESSGAPSIYISFRPVVRLRVTATACQTPSFTVFTEIRFPQLEPPVKNLTVPDTIVINQSCSPAPHPAISLLTSPRQAADEQVSIVFIQKETVKSSPTFMEEL